MSEFKSLYWLAVIKLVRLSFRLGLDDFGDWIGDVSGLRFRLEQFIRRQL